MPGRSPARSAAGLTRVEREERAAKIVEQYNRGWSMTRIGKFWGISAMMVSKILKKAREEWRETKVSNYEEFALARCEEYRFAREQAWRGWFRSMKDAQRIVEEMGIERDEEGEITADDTMRILKRVTTREGQTGDSSFINAVLKAYHDEAVLLGYMKSGITVNNTNVNANAPNLQDALDALRGRPDPVEERLAGAVEMPDRAEGA